MRHSDAVDLGSLSFLLENRPADRRALRVGLAAAAVLHGLLFAVTWPVLDLTPPASRSEPTIIRLHPMPRFAEPPPPTEALPQPPARRVPVPDLTPFDAEPQVREPPVEVVPLPPELVLGRVEIPAPPPEPPTVVDVGVEVAPPVKLHHVRPPYPEAARRARVEGPVVLQLLIDPAGTVGDVTVLRGLPLGLTEAAVAAASQWRFEPSRVDGRPVSVRYRLTVVFTLQR